MSERPYITCRELIDFIAEYLDGGLDDAPRVEFERHLGVCPSCVAYLDSYRTTVSLGKEALRPTDEPVNGSVPEAFVRAVLAARARERR